MAEEMYIPGAHMLLRTPEGDIIHAYGVRELDGDEPMTVDDHNSRRFSHQADDRTVILQSVQEGAIALDDPVSDYRPDVTGGDDITIAELLNMRSGLFNYSGTYELDAGLDETPGHEWDPEGTRRHRPADLQAAAVTGALLANDQMFASPSWRTRRAGSSRRRGTSPTGPKSW